MIRKNDFIVVCIKSILNFKENEHYYAHSDAKILHVYQNGWRYMPNKENKYFITLAEWRDKQINSILYE
jgi:hypothetical protein